MCRVKKHVHLLRVIDQNGPIWNILKKNVTNDFPDVGVCGQSGGKAQF